ncbi:MAG: hypothetical protein LUG18_10295 [Candidatus Azobacteroides sp.]|nr:hypothetical protein [Candidatus Azobacteroides sp.]
MKRIIIFGLVFLSIEITCHSQKNGNQSGGLRQKEEIKGNNPAWQLNGFYREYIISSDR